MIQVLIRIFKHSIAYGFGTVLNRAVTVILLPLYARYLTKTEYGILELLMVTSSIVVLILQLGLGSALFRSIIYKENVDKKKVTSTAFFFLLFIASLSILGLIAFSKAISNVLIGDSDYSKLLVIVFIGDLFLILTSIPMARLRIEERSTTFAFIAGGNFLVGILLNLLLVIKLHWGLIGIITANAITSFIFVIVFTSAVSQDIGFAFSFSALKDMLGFGLPLVPMAAFNMILMMSDRYFIRFYYNLEQVAIYGAALRISMVVELLVSAFQMAWPAVMFSLAKEKNAAITFAKLFNYFLFMLIIAGMVIAVFSKEIINLMATAKYIDGAAIVPLIIVASIFNGINYYSSIGIQVHKKTYIFPIILGMAVAVNISLNFHFVPNLGILGAGFVRLISFGFIGISILTISLKYFYIPYEYLKLGMIIIFAIGGYLLSTIIQFEAFYLTIFSKFILIMAFLCVLFLAGYFEKTHLDELKKMLLPT